MTVIQEERGRLNAYAIEPKMYIDPKTMKDNYVTHNEKAELLNGRFAMLGELLPLWEHMRYPGKSFPEFGDTSWCNYRQLLLELVGRNKYYDPRTCVGHWCF